MKRKIFVIFLFCLTISVGIYSEHKIHLVQKFQDIYEEYKLKQIVALNPEEEVSKATVRKDFRFAGVGGYGLHAPGVSEEDNRYLDKYGMWEITGASTCRLIGGEELREKAEQYALKYNTLLLQYLKKKPG